MSLFDDLFLISAKGIAPRDILEVRNAASREAGSSISIGQLQPAEIHRWVVSILGSGSRGRIVWPRRGVIERPASRLEAIGAAVAWRGDDTYPNRLIANLGEDAPAWVLVVGDRARLESTQCAVIGSRETPPAFAEGAYRLGNALAEAGIVVTSGMARGADEAAHAGALEGAAGTVGIPARGLLRVIPSLPPHVKSKMTLLGLAAPRAEFNTGLAIRRNYAIAALCDVLVLVASGVTGGSTYALNWTLRRGRPVFCFEDGKYTPQGNAGLLRARAAAPLHLHGDAQEWVARIREAVSKSPPETQRARHKRVSQPSLMEAY